MNSAKSTVRGVLAVDDFCRNIGLPQSTNTHFRKGSGHGCRRWMILEFQGFCHSGRSLHQFYFCDLYIQIARPLAQMCDVVVSCGCLKLCISIIPRRDSDVNPSQGFSVRAIYEMGWKGFESRT